MLQFVHEKRKCRVDISGFRRPGLFPPTRFDGDCPADSCPEMTDGMDRDASGGFLVAGGTFRGCDVLRFVGKGGMGEVWLLRHPVLRSDFAVKIIPPDVLDSDDEAKERFFREARIAANIRHPSLVAVYDGGRDPETGYYFLLMDYLSGGTVADRIERERRLPVREASRIVRSVAKGLVELNRNGIVHRDVKPSNMLIAADGSVKLSDPGIARVSGSGEATLTLPDFALGTPLYMPYEQIVDSHAVDCRADIFALGISYFEMLTGVCPDAELSPGEIFAKRVDGAPIPDIRGVNTAIPADVAGLISRMTELDVAKRLVKPEAVVVALDGILRDPCRRTESVRTVRMPWNWFSAGIGVLAGLVFFSVWWMASEASKTGSGTDGTALFEEAPGFHVPDPIDPAPVLATQIVRSVREVVKTVVVTNVVDIAPRAPDAAADAPLAPETAAVDGGGETGMPSVVRAGPGEKRSVSICGISVVYPGEMEKEKAMLVEMTQAAERKVRWLLAVPGGESVQTTVRRIVLTRREGDGEYDYDSSRKELVVPPACSGDVKRLAMLVARFMTSRRDAPREPFADVLYRYAFLKTYDALVPGAGEALLKKALSRSDRLESLYRSADYNGCRFRYGTRNQTIPVRFVREYRTGMIFGLFERIGGFGGAERLFAGYFACKRATVKLGGGRGSTLSDSDFAALLSKASGKDMFSVLTRNGWCVDRHATRLDE